MSAPTAQISDSRLLGRWAGLPIPILLLAIALFVLLDPRGVFQPPWLLPILGFIFSGVISIVVAYLAFYSYLAGGSESVLLLGCGMLTFGLSNTMGSLVSDLHDPNVGVAFFNIAVVIAGLCHLGSAVWATAASRPTWRRPRGRLYPGLAYGAVLLFLTLLLQAIQAHRLPTFFIQGQGPTPIRQVVLGTAVLLFALAATQFWALARRTQRVFFRWYGLGLGLIAVGLVGVYLQKAIGTPLNWVGRSAQYLGGVYILVGLLSVLQDRGLPLRKALALFFGEAETEYRPLVEAAKDAILSLDADGHILYWNEGAAHLLGYTAAEAFGRHLTALAAAPGTEERLRKAWDGLPRTTEGRMIGATLESKLAAKDGRVFWAELAFYSRPGARGSLTVCILRDITERKQAENALLRLNEELEARVAARTAELDAERTRWKQVVQGIADEVWVCDLLGRMTLVNLPAVTHMGLEEFKDKSVEQVSEVVEILNPDGQPRPPEQAPGLRSLRGEVVRGEEIMRDLSTGTTRWRQFSSAPIRDAAGTIIGSVAVVRDVTDQKQMEEQLRELSQRLTYHVDHSPLAVIEWGPDMRLTRWSGAAERIFGWTAAEVLGKRMEDFRWIYDEDNPQVVEVSADLQTGTNLRRFSATRSYRKDGSVVECEWYNSSLVDGAGQLLSILSLVLDVTERKRAEEALESVAEFPNENPHPVLRVARDGILLYANRESTPLLRLWNCQVGQRLPADWCARLAAVFEVRGGEEVDVACGERIFSCILHRIAGRDYLNIYGRDITKRKAAEAALQQLNAELEVRVTQRTAELSNALLKLSVQSGQLRTLASELTLVEQRERSRLAELIHDGLQQLLVAARLRVTMVGRGAGPNTQEDCQEIGRLLDEAAADARSLTVELSPPILRTGGLPAGLDWLARWSQEKHHLTVHLQGPPDPIPPVPEDLTVLLFQSVRELLFNTVKYAQVPDAVVTLACREEGLTITVADAGVGFEPSSLRGEGGVAGGFGLARIRHRLELLGGCMDIDSAPGRGSRITLAIPMRAADQQAPPPPGLRQVSSPQTTVGPGPGKPTKIRVLIADDHQVVRRALAQMLSTETDIEVVGEAGTGTAAVVLARQLGPDVVLMDINMPEMNGIDAARAIHTAFPAMRLIGLSMFDRGDQQSAMQDAGAVAYVSKSGPTEELLAAIRGGR